MHPKTPVQAGWDYEIASVYMLKTGLKTFPLSWAQAKSHQGINCRLLPQGVESVRKVRKPGKERAHSVVEWKQNEP